MPTLYTTPLSANGRKALALVRHLELPVDVRLVNVYRGEGRSPAFLSINPWGKVPTLVDDAAVLWESNAILVYLSEQFADFRLFSRDPVVRADMLRWMFWESSHWQPTLTRVLARGAGELLLEKSASAKSSVSWDDAELVALLRGFESILEQRSYVCGAELSIADFSIGGMTTYFRVLGFPMQRFPAIAAWLRRMDDVVAWAPPAPPTASAPPAPTTASPPARSPSPPATRTSDAAPSAPSAPPPARSPLARTPPAPHPRSRSETTQTHRSTGPAPARRSPSPAPRSHPAPSQRPRACRPARAPRPPSAAARQPARHPSTA